MAQRETHADDDHDPYDSEDDRLYRVARGVHDGQFGAETAEPPRIRAVQEGLAVGTSSLACRRSPRGKAAESPDIQ